MFKIVSTFCFLILLSTLAHAAQKHVGPQVLIVPYQVNAGDDMAYLQEDVPKLLLERLQNQNILVVPLARARTIVDQQKIETLDLKAARQMGTTANVQAVVYGVFNQLGDGFTLDSRIVPIANNQIPDVVTVQRKSIIDLAAAVDLLSSRVASIIYQDKAPVDAIPTITDLTPAKSGGLVDVQVKGMRIMDPDAVLMRLSIRKGDTPDAAAINEEVKRVWDMGYFSDVSAIMQGNILIFNVVEKPRIDVIQVEGSDEIDEDDILAAMSTKTGAVLNDRLLSDDIQKVTELYRKEGFFLAEVKHQVIPKDDGSGARLLLTVTEGNKLYIQKVTISGLNGLDQDDISDYMALQPRTIFSWITGTGVLEEEYLERDSNAIAAFGLNEGYVDIQVSAPDVEYKPDGIYITFQVNEGPRYKINEIQFGGDLIDTEDRLLHIIEMDAQKENNEFFALSVMQEDTKRLTQFYGDYGYAFAEVETKILKDESGAPMLNVGYLVNKKQKVYIRRAIVEGNSRTRDNVILRELRLADGDIYAGAKMRRSTERLNRLGYFESVDTELVPTGVDEEVDLKIKVKEGNTGSIMAGIGYSTYYDVGVSGSIMERNLFGRGYWLQLQGFFSWRRTSGTLSFTNPRLYDTDLLIGNDIYYSSDNWDDFDKDTLGDSFRVAYPIGEYTSIGAGYRIERYELYGIDTYSSPSIRDYEGTNWTSAVNARITRDTTDARHPTKGTITRLWAEYGGGGLGGTDNFVKAMVDWQAFYSVVPDHVAHIRARVGGVFENKKDALIPVFERFYVGGIDTIRGYDYTSLSPRDQIYGDRIGGDRMGVLNIEYIWTFQKDLGLSIVPFLDAGFNIDSSYMDLEDHIVYSTGLELRWRSPMGDLRIAYGIPLSEDYDGDRPGGRFEFTMGQNF